MQKRRVTQLTRAELTELKRAYLCETNRKITIKQLNSQADEIVSDEVIFNHHKNSLFCDDDFFCNAEKERKGA